MEPNRHSHYFLISLSLLVLFGLIMVYSSSYIYAKEYFGGSSFFFFKQLTYVLIGVGILLVGSRVPFDWFYRNSYKINLAILFLILMTFVGAFSVEVKGASRWISLMGFRFQPGELLKYSVLLCSLHYFQNFHFFSNRERWIKLFFLFFPVLLLLFQPDFGMFSLCLLNIVFVCFLSDFPRRYFYSFVAISLIAAALVGAMAPYRVKRFMTFLDPWADPLNSGFQIIQSFLGFANGFIFGQGLGNSNEKLFYLPEAHNDFILSVIGEELGFVGVFFTVTLFSLLVYFGFKMALTIKKNRQEAQVFAVAAISSIGMQAFLNMAVVLGLLPTKGLTLPFISYGGSSLLANFFLISIFFSACLHRVGERILSHPSGPEEAVVDEKWG